MEDKKLVKLLKRSDERALEKIIRIYTGYVSTVIAHQLGELYEVTALEELTSDVFLALWQSRMNIVSYHLRGWLGATARNKAKNYLRALSVSCKELEEDTISYSDNSLFDLLEKKEQCRIVKKALSKIRLEEREVIVRYYYYNQTVRNISEEMGLNHETVKSRLQRGRAKLKDILEKGGYFS